MMTCSETDRDAYQASSADIAIRTSEADVDHDYWLNVALEDSFPCSDPISSMRTA